MVAPRVAQNVRRCRRCLKRGTKGVRCFRFEWMRYKRVLQVHKKRRFKSVQLKPVSFFSKFYRLDEDNDYKALIGAHAPVGAAVGAGGSGPGRREEHRIPEISMFEIGGAGDGWGRRGA